MARKFISKLARLMEKYASKEESAVARSAQQAKEVPQVQRPRKEQLDDETMNTEIAPRQGDVDDVHQLTLDKYEELRREGNLPPGPLESQLREIQTRLIESGELDTFSEGSRPRHQDIKPLTKTHPRGEEATTYNQVVTNPDGTAVMRDGRPVLVTRGNETFRQRQTSPRERVAIDAEVAKSDAGKPSRVKKLPAGPEPEQGRTSNIDDVDRVNAAQEKELRGNILSIQEAGLDSPAVRAILADNAILADATDNQIFRIIGKALKDKQGKTIKEDPDANFTINQFRRIFGENPKKGEGEQVPFLGAIRAMFGRASGRAAETNRRTDTPREFPTDPAELAEALRRGAKNSQLAKPNKFKKSVEEVTGPLNPAIAKQQRAARAVKAQRVEDLKAARKLEEGAEGRPVSAINMTPRQIAIFEESRSSNSGALSREIMARIKKDNPQAIPAAELEVKGPGRQSEGSLTGDFETTQSAQNTQNIRGRSDKGVKPPLEEGDPVSEFDTTEQISTVRSPDDVPTISTGAVRNSADLSRIRQIEANQAKGQIDPNVRLRPEQFEQPTKTSKTRAGIIRQFEDDPQDVNRLGQILSESPVAEGERVNAQELLLRVLRTLSPQEAEPILLDILKGLRGRTPISSRTAGLRPPTLPINPRPSKEEGQAFLRAFRKDLGIPEVAGQKGASDKFLAEQNALLNSIGGGDFMRSKKEIANG